MRKIGLGAAWLVTLLVGTLLLSGWLGWLDMERALELVMGTVALGGLWLVVWLPWDLFFAARALAVEQEDGAARGIEVSDADRAEAKKLAPRLLTLCLALHVGAAGGLALATWLTDGALGYWFAASYLAAIALRPLGAFHRHMRARREALHARTRHPREDVVALRHRVEALEDTTKRLEEVDLPALAERDDAIEAQQTADRHEGRARLTAVDAKMDEVLLELERSISRLTRDRELLQGIRAFVRAVKEA